MPQFMLILHEFPGSYKNMSPEEMQKVLEQYNAWTGKVAQSGKLVAGHKLTDDGGKLIAKGGARPAAVDGPYVETKEVVGGYFIVRAKDYAEAIDIVSDCPHRQFGKIEVRQVDFMGQPET
ncbi:MAG TPA: YciI family protein [Gemmataceae bacterium]|jgi:hypothetical protein